MRRPPAARSQLSRAAATRKGVFAPNPGTRLLGMTEYRSRLLSAYTDVLNTHVDAAPFRETLIALHDRLRVDRRDSPFRRRPKASKGHLRLPQLTPEADAEVDTFMARWRLPRPLRPILRNFLLGPLRTESPRLGRRIGVSTADYDDVILKAPAPRRLTYATFDDPAYVRAQAREEAERVYEAFVHQMNLAEAAWRARGFKTLHPQRQSPEALQKQALRVMRRGLLRWSWQKIARAEFPPPPLGHELEHVPDSAVRGSVRRWAKELDIPLENSAP